MDSFIGFLFVCFVIILLIPEEFWNRLKRMMPILKGMFSIFTDFSNLIKNFFENVLFIFRGLWRCFIVYPIAGVAQAVKAIFIASANAKKASLQRKEEMQKIKEALSRKVATAWQKIKEGQKDEGKTELLALSQIYGEKTVYEILDTIQKWEGN